MKNIKIFLDDIRLPIDCNLYKTSYKPLTDKNIELYSDNDWVIVRNYESFTKAISELFLNKQAIDIISFDHDLADIHYANVNGIILPSENQNEKTGAECAKWLVDFCIDNKYLMPKILIHSMNPVGSKNIELIINDYFKFKNKFS